MLPVKNAPDAFKKLRLSIPFRTILAGRNLDQSYKSHRGTNRRGVAERRPANTRPETSLAPRSSFSAVTARHQSSWALPGRLKGEGDAPKHASVFCPATGNRRHVRSGG